MATLKSRPSVSSLPIPPYDYDGMWRESSLPDDKPASAKLSDSQEASTTDSFFHEIPRGLEVAMDIPVYLPCSHSQQEFDCLSSASEWDFDMSSTALDLSKMTRQELRKHRNRESAARSRKRSRDKMEYLEELVQELRTKNVCLQRTVNRLTQESMSWRSASGPMPMHHVPAMFHAPQHLPLPIGLSRGVLSQPAE